MEQMTLYIVLWLAALILTIYFLVIENRAIWTVIYEFKTRTEPMKVYFKSMREAEEHALVTGFKHFKRTKMVVNYSEKTITIS